MGNKISKTAAFQQKEDLEGTPILSKVCLPSNQEVIDLDPLSDKEIDDKNASYELISLEDSTRPQKLSPQLEPKQHNDV